MSIKAYVCHHDSEESFLITKEICNRFPFMIPYKLNASTLFESDFFKNVEIDENCKYIGMITYRVYSRLNVLMLNIGYILHYSEADVVAVNYYPKYYGVTLKKTEFSLSNPGFNYIWKKLMNVLLPELSDDEIFSDDIPMFYNNYWYAKPKVLLEYREFLKKAEIELEKIPEVYNNAGYTGNCTKEELEKISGKPYYTFHPFIFERLPCIFVWYKKYSYIYTCSEVKVSDYN